MKNKEELEKNTGVKHFDICLMNPPYGTNESGNKDIHFKFVSKCNQISNKNIVIMPFRMFIATNNKFDNYKNEYQSILQSVEQVDPTVFDLQLSSAAIYEFDNVNGNNNHIKINLINGTEKNIDSLLDFTYYEINEYEQTILKYLDNKGNVNYHLVGAAGKKGRQEDFIKGQYKKKFNPDDVLLITNFSYSGETKFMSSKTGQIFRAKDAEKCDYAMKGYRSVILKFKTFEEAENCKIALNNPALRFGLSKLKDCQDISKRMRRYIPNIDWSDNRVRTDEGLFEVCGCPKDKCKEYAEYCKKIIDEVDKGNRP